MQKTFAEIIDMAIQREVVAYDFYMDIYHKVQDESVRDTVEFIAKEEIKHKEFLVGYRAGNFGSDSLRMADVVDYKIAEYLEEPEIDKESSSQEVYLIASHREAKSHLFYTELAGMHADSELKTMLLKMANEELKHKEKMEYLYSNAAFPQTSGGWETRDEGRGTGEDGRGMMDEKKTNKIRTVRDLKVYRKAFESAMEIFELTKKFPKE